jgi:hypothetical protein
MPDADNSPGKVVTLTVRPPIGSPFTIDVPSDWLVVPMGEDSQVDFATSDQLQMLAVYAPPSGSASASVSARPKFASGGLQEWMEAIAVMEGLTVVHLTRDSIGTSPAAICLGTRDDDELGPLRALYVLFEDGGILYALSAMVTEELWESLAATFEQVLLSFRILEPKGPTVERPVQAQPAYDELTYAHFALADTPESFGVDNEMNQLAPDQTDAQVPSVWEVDAAGKFAALSFASIDGIVNVPFGWNVNDDGQAARVFDLEHERVIVFSWLAGPKDADAAFGAILTPVVEENPDVEILQLEFDGHQAVGLDGLTWHGRAFRRIVFLVDVPTRDSGLLKVELDAAPDDIERLLVLVRFMLRDIRIV